MPNRLPKVMTTETLSQAKEHGVKNTQLTIFVQRKEEICLLMVSPLPTVCATTKEAIEKWMKRTK